MALDHHSVAGLVFIDMGCDLRIRDGKRGVEVRVGRGKSRVLEGASGRVVERLQTWEPGVSGRHRGWKATSISEPSSPVCDFIHPIATRQIQDLINAPKLLVFPLDSRIQIPTVARSLTNMPSQSTSIYATRGSSRRCFSLF